MSATSIPTALSEEESAQRMLSISSNMPAPMSSNVSLGSYKISMALDGDGHLTLVVCSQDGSRVREIDTEVGCKDDEIGLRFSTDAIEKASI